MHTLGYEELCDEGLVNEDEWQTILANEAYGMPRYMTVMYWVEVWLVPWPDLLTPSHRLPHRSQCSCRFCHGVMPRCDATV